MHRALTRVCLLLLLATALLKPAGAQNARTWQEVPGAKFEAANPTLQAGQISVGTNRERKRLQPICVLIQP